MYNKSKKQDRVQFVPLIHLISGIVHFTKNGYNRAQVAVVECKVCESDKSRHKQACGSKGRITLQSKTLFRLNSMLIWGFWVVLRFWVTHDWHICAEGNVCVWFDYGLTPSDCPFISPILIAMRLSAICDSVLGRILPRPCKLVLWPSFLGHGAQKSCGDHLIKAAVLKVQASQMIYQVCTNVSLLSAALGLFLVITAVHWVQRILCFASLLFYFHTLSLACFHMSVWLFFC